MGSSQKPGALTVEMQIHPMRGSYMGAQGDLSGQQELSDSSDFKRTLSKHRNECLEPEVRGKTSESSIMQALIPMSL